MTHTENEFILFGDVEAAVVDVLSSASEIVAYSPAVTVATDMVGYNQDDRWVEVRRSGGSYRFANPEKPRVDIRVHGKNRADAHDIAQLCVAIMFREAGFYTGKGVKLISTKLELGLIRIPDLYNEGDSYFFTLRLTVKPS